MGNFIMQQHKGHSQHQLSQLNKKGSKHSMLGGKKSSHKHGKKGLENLNTFATPAGLVSDGLGFGGIGAWGAAPFAGAYGAEFGAPFGAYGAWGAEPFAAAPFAGAYGFDGF